MRILLNRLSFCRTRFEMPRVPTKEDRSSMADLVRILQREDAIYLDRLAPR